MSKKLNQWLDEFIDNGADASDVTNWPENAGGGDSGEIVVDTSGTAYKIDPVELARLAGFISGEGSIGDGYAIDGSGNEHVGSIVYLSYTGTTYSLQIGLKTIFSIDGDHFTNWSDHITEYATEISAEEIYAGDGEIFVGIIRGSGHSIIQSFDLSKLLIKQEQESIQE